MRNLGAKEAAAEIHDDIVHGVALHTDPERAHQILFLKAVCEELHLDPTPETINHVASVLHRHDIAIHEGHEWPKYVTRKYDNTSHIANDEHEADAIINAEPPPVNDAPRVVDDRPMQDTSLDLRGKVPHMVKPDHPAGRAPDELTNAAAAQRPEVFNADNNAAHDHNPGSEAHDEDGEDPDNSVSLDEDFADPVEDPPAPPAPPAAPVPRKPIGSRRPS